MNVHESFLSSPSKSLQDLISRIYFPACLDVREKINSYIDSIWLNISQKPTTHLHNFGVHRNGDVLRFLPLGSFAEAPVLTDLNLHFYLRSTYREMAVPEDYVEQFDELVNEAKSLQHEIDKSYRLIVTARNFGFTEKQMEIIFGANLLGYMKKTKFEFNSTVTPSESNVVDFVTKNHHYISKMQERVMDNLLMGYTYGK